MALSNTAIPKYYGMFRDAVIRGEIPVCKEISMEMNRIDDLIANPGVYYDDQAVEGWIAYCEIRAYFDWMALTLVFWIASNFGANRSLAGTTSSNEAYISQTQMVMVGIMFARM